MKNLFLGALLLLTGCNAATTANTTAKSDHGQLILPINKDVRVPDNGATVKLSKLISDSRCPEGTQCVWAGYAEVEIITKDKSGNTKTHRVRTEPSSAKNTFRLEGHTYRLVSVYPAAKAAQKTILQSAVLEEAKPTYDTDAGGAE